MINFNAERFVHFFVLIILDFWTLLRLFFIAGKEEFANEEIAEGSFVTYYDGFRLKKAGRTETAMCLI